VINVIDPLSNMNPPIANPDVAITIMNTPVITNVLANDKAANLGVSLNPVSLSISVQPKHGSVNVNTDGTIVYTPANGYTGSDTLTYNICDNTKPIPICNTALVYYTINTTNTLPVTSAADDYMNALAGNIISGNVILNDKNSAGANLSISNVSTVPVSKGIFLMNANGTFTFTPASGFTGPIDIIYTVCSGSPSICANATLHILIEPVIPTKILNITKIANSAKMNLDGSFNIDFVLKVQNLTSDFIDSVLVKDDLTKVFKDTRGLSVVSINVSGKLIKNSNYNGITNTDLLLIQSALDGKNLDSIILTINMANNLSGNFENTAVVSAPTIYGTINSTSTDPTLVTAASDTTRKPTGFVIPKVDVVIPGGFSPNNDGIDDAWVIKRPYGTTISVKVFNRWGNEVYINSNYMSDWKGKGVSNFIGEDVPEGTYYYVVEATDIDNITRKFAGSLTLVR
jgi:gliding motility-associated-like protein